MKVFVSGATGFIGSHLALRLARDGHTVHALYRTEKKAEVLKQPGIILFRGDILDPESLEKAVEGCDYVFHVAAFASIWAKNFSDIYHLNISGSLNVIHTSIKHGVKRIVITSTAAVLGHSSGNEVIDENSEAKNYFIHYEHSKAILENIVSTLSLSGIDILTVNPSRVFGPGLLSESNSVAKMIKMYMKGQWRIIPGNGKSVGNYVYIDDVVEGHIRALEKGKAGERYILGGENRNFDELFSTIAQVHGKKYSMIKVPLFLMMIIAGISTALAWLTNGNPLITPALVKKYNHNYILSSEKARRELGYEPISLRDAVEKTIRYLNRNSEKL